MIVVVAFLAFLVGLMLRPECPHCTPREHVWRPVRADEVLEEVSICDECGLYASEAAKPCIDQVCIECGYYASDHTEQGCPRKDAA